MTNPKEVLGHYKSEWESRVMNMKPGSEMDALVAEKVMGYETTPSIFFDDFDKSKSYYCTAGSPGSEEINAISYLNGSWEQYTFDPSESISTAWEVVEKMHEWGGCEISCCGTGKKRWYVVHTYTDAKIQRGITVTSHTAPEAICKAALLAVGVNGE